MSHSLDREIKEVQKQLDELRADESKIAQLLTEKTNAIQSMQAEKSRDYAALAELEGQRAALASMLTEQQSEVSTRAALLSDLERQKARSASLAELGKRAERLEAQRLAAEEAVSELGPVVLAALQRVTQAREAWREARQDALSFAASRFRLDFPSMSNTADNEAVKREWWAVFAELSEAGYPGGALRHSPCEYPKGDHYAFTQYWEGSMSPSQLDYARHRLGQALPRPVLAALAGAVQTAEAAQGFNLEGKL